MARATKKASASRTSRSTPARAKATKPAKKTASKARASKKAVAKAASSKKPAAKKVSPKKSPAKKLVKQVTGTRKAGKTTVSAKKAAAKAGKQGTASKATAKPVKTATKPAVKPAATPTKAEAPPVKAPVKAPKKQEPPVVETAPKKPRKRELTSREVQQIRAQLEQQKENFLREYNELEEGSFTVSQSEMSGEVSFDEEYADAGTFTFEREKELSIGNNIRDLLDRVNAAINAIDAGTYGFCENCGDPINKARLLALPYTTLCIRCKQLEERSR